MERRPNLDDLTNIEIIDRYRLDRDGIDYVENILSRQITPKAYRNHAISARHKLLITLRYLATGPIQLNDCDIHGVSQPTVSRVLGEMLNVLSDPRLVRQFISFPTDAADLRRNATIFEGIANFPKVMGLIDGTHIRIRAPSEDEYMYETVQVVVDGEDKIIDIVARWPGSVHDARILRESGLSQLLDNGSHKTTRSRVEKAIGQLKRRFGVLHTEITLSPEKACKVVIACAVLHNLCIARGIPFADNQDDDNGNNNNGDPRPQDQMPGLRYRDYYAATYFHI
ncbi:LOW QUALITY PROTEIN: HARB1-like protein [Mya arenaria]|uniref:HARB1-like protein n=1 Tax=Mya arenaria TaxID=6604 RepID=A0ABY7G2D7_MYAAR|nr:LOW QUALITY PROTEIN: HARB1-like protein [Mya arenaria]